MNVLAISHGEKAWSLRGHTGTTDIPLPDNRRRLAERMPPVLARNAFALVLCSPMRRARETCELAGLGASALLEDESMSDTNRERAGRQRDSKHAITRDRTVELINQFRDQGFKVAVVTSSQNCTAVLKAAKLDHCFDVQVDCDVIHAEHLAGKPAPDTYLMAAKSVVIEDALAGMQAGSNGNFGFVIGVARKRNAVELRHHGARLVVNDLSELVS